MSEPRAYTEEECRSMVLRHLQGVAHYCANESRQPTVEDKLDLLVFCFLTMIDGATDLPAFRLVPAPHHTDAEYHQENGENWWPEDLEDVSDGDLHGRWAQKKF